MIDTKYCTKKELLEEEKNILFQISMARSRLAQETQDAINAEANIEREAYNAKLGRIRALETAEEQQIFEQ